MITIQKARARTPIIRGQLSSYGGRMDDGKWKHTFTVADASGQHVEVLIDGDTFIELLQGWETRK